MVLLTILIAISSGGCINQSTTQKDIVNDAICVDFAHSPKNPSMVSIIQFESNMDKGLFHYWDFGDGSTSIKSSPTHRYLKSGEFNVTLRGINLQSGENFSHTKTIVVTEKDLSGSQNKWAILGVRWKSDGSKDYFYADYVKIRSILVSDLGFTDDHIFDFENEEFNKKNMVRALGIVKDASPSWEDATILLWLGAHGCESLASGVVSTVDGAPSHSFLIDHPENSPPTDPSNIFLWDYELKEILDNYTLSSQKVLVVIEACQSGCFAAQDTTGTFHGDTDFLFTSCGGANRIIITDATAPLSGTFGMQAQCFWKEGLVEGKGDTNPINGNNNGKTSVEEAWFYYKSRLAYLGVATAQPCMNDQYPAEKPEEEMFL